MLIELAVRDLGVIAELRLTLGPGLTALTGETGAGKTMLVEAIGLLLGGRAEGARVRPGAEAAVVEGLFADGEREVVLRRVVPATGRSRAYVDGGLVPTGRLAELGSALIEVHGQHAHLWLARPGGRREALDRFGSIDPSPVRAAGDEVRRLEARLEELGGDERSRVRELDLLRYQRDELAAAALEDPAEEERLAAEEDLLADAVAHREAAQVAGEALAGDGAAVDQLAVVAQLVDGRAPFGAVHERLEALRVELEDLGRDLRTIGESIDDDPDRLGAVRARRQLLVELRRKYGDTLAEVIAEQEAIDARVAELEAHDATAVALGRQLDEARTALARAEATLADARRAAAGRLGDALDALAPEVALDGATFAVTTSGTAGREVDIEVATNRGLSPGPVAKVASGGELSRVMLAVHLALSAGPPTMVFDEVDAGIGGATATRVGRALARLAQGRQVLVVTHLPQVAAFADHQLAVHKHDDGRTTTTTVVTLDADDRVVELSRMLSGSPDSAAAHAHADEMLSAAAAERASAGDPR